MASQMPPLKSTVRTTSDETHRHSESEEDAILAIMISPDDLDDVRWPSHVQRFLSVSSFSPVPYDIRVGEGQPSFAPGGCVSDVKKDEKAAGFLIWMSGPYRSIEPIWVRES